MSRIDWRAAAPMGLFGLAAYSVNECLQYLVQKDVIDYQAFMGYGSNIAAPISYMASMLFFSRHMSEKGQKLAAAAVPVVLSAVEVAQYNMPQTSASRFDPYDIVCHFAGALAAYAGAKALHERREKRHKARQEPSKYTLEKLVEDTFQASCFSIPDSVHRKRPTA